MKKSTLGMKETTVEQHMSNATKRPKNPSANVLPTEGYVLEIDGKFKSEYVTLKEALKARLDLKGKYPQIQVKVYGAKERTGTVVELPEQSERKPKSAS